MKTQTITTPIVNTLKNLGKTEYLRPDALNIKAADKIKEANIKSDAYTYFNPCAPIFESTKPQQVGQGFDFRF